MHQKASKRVCDSPASSSAFRGNLGHEHNKFQRRDGIQQNAKTKDTARLLPGLEIGINIAAYDQIFERPASDSLP